MYIILYKTILWTFWGELVPELYHNPTMMERLIILFLEYIFL